MPGLAAAAATPARRLTTLAVLVRVTAWRVLLAGELGDAESKDISKWVRSCEPAPPPWPPAVARMLPPKPPAAAACSCACYRPPRPPQQHPHATGPPPQAPHVQSPKGPPSLGANGRFSHAQNPGAPHKKLYNFIFNFILIFTKCCLPALLQKITKDLSTNL